MTLTVLEKAARVMRGMRMFEAPAHGGERKRPSGEIVLHMVALPEADIYWGYLRHE
jgi:hypothetical protein